MKISISMLSNLIACLMVLQPLAAQPISIGASCPSFPVQNLLKERPGFPETWTFQKKLTVIDYWGTGCSACVADFPRLEALARMYSNDLQIILVNSESRDSTLLFFAKRPKIKLPDLPMMSGDSLIASWFPFQSLSQHIWVNQEKKVMAITIAQNANSYRVSEFLAGKSFAFLEMKPLPLAKWDMPLIVLDSVALSNVISYSYLSHAVAVFGMEDIKISSQGNSVFDRIVLNKEHALSLFKTAYGDGTEKYSSRNSVILQVKDTLRYMSPGDKSLINDWLKSSSYYYELKLPPAQSDQLYPTMQNQLSSYFNVIVRKEKRRIKCLVLTRIGPTSLLNTKGGEFEMNLSDPNRGATLYFKNAQFLYFAWNLGSIFNAYASPLPFVDATGITSNIDMEISSAAWDELPNYAALNKALKKYGIRIEEKDHLADVLVIRENDLKK